MMMKIKIKKMEKMKKRGKRGKGERGEWERERHEKVCLLYLGLPGKKKKKDE